MLLAGFLVVVVGGGIWLYFFLTSVADPAAKTAPPLIVSARDAGKQGVYKSIKAALRVAKQGNVIQIADDTIADNIDWEWKGRSTEVTIQAAPGTEVVWRSASKDPAVPLIRLTNAEFFKLKGPGLILDGSLGDKGKIKDLVLMMGSSHGVTIEEVRFRDFGRSAVCVHSAEGNAENPIQLKGLTALTPPATKEGALIFIDAQPDMRIKQVDYLEITAIQGLPPEQLVRAESSILGRNVQIPGLKRE